MRALPPPPVLTRARPQLSRTVPPPPCHLLYWPRTLARWQDCLPFAAEPPSQPRGRCKRHSQQRAACPAPAVSPLPRIRPAQPKSAPAPRLAHHGAHRSPCALVVPRVSTAGEKRLPQRAPAQVVVPARRLPLSRLWPAPVHRLARASWELLRRGRPFFLSPGPS